MGSMQLHVLSEAEMATIHQRSLDVFERVGIRILHEEALRKLASMGGKVDEPSGTVRLPRQLVSDLLERAPAVAMETGLNGRQLAAGGINQYCLSLILDPFIIDYQGGPRRPILEDVRRHTILGESLPRIDSMMRMQFPVADIPGPDSYLKTMEVFLCHTTKHTAVYPVSVENCREWMEVAAVIADAAGLDVQNTPLLSVAMAVTSPLCIHGPNVEIMKMAMECCYPIISTVCPMAGTTAPYSLAGTLLASNVEALAPVLLAQVFKPGHPVFYGIGPSVTDMKTVQDLYYSPEKMLWKIAAAQLGAFYRLPVSGEAGGSLTWRPDVQNGAESMAYLLASFTGGQNVIGGFGSLHNANGMSAEQIVMQCGLADMAEYLARGICTCEGKLGFDSIQEVGPGGAFLTDPMTLRLLRGNEFFKSDLLDRTGGYVSSAPGIYELAHRKVTELIEAYQPTVPGRVREAIERFFAPRYADRQLAARS